MLVVVNGSLTDAGRAKLEPVSDEILVRENVGFDIWAHKEALDHVGAGLTEFDEVVLTNDTWFGPVRPYGPVFERMQGRAVHFWGMTDHAEEVPNPFTNEGRLPYHLQSFWIAVRREMFLSEAWGQYWRDLPEMPSYFDAVLKHEAVFTEYFTDRGHTVDVAYPSAAYPTDHPALFNSDMLLADGCPLLKRRPFFHYPPFLDRHAVIGRRILQAVAAYGFPVDVIWQNLARNVQPKVLNTDAGMLEVLPETDVSYDPERPLRIVAIAHFRAGDEATGILERLRAIPVPFDLVVTTSDAGGVDALRAMVDSFDSAHLGAREVRVIAHKRGRDMSAFFVGCRDILTGGSYDLVIKVHGRVPSGRKENVRRYFRRYQVENLLSSPGYVANVLGLFQKEPGLGLVFPPMVHIGYATAGRGWYGYLGEGVDLCKELGIRVPLDGLSPLAPLGGMWISRVDALGVIAEREWTYDEYGKQPRSTRAELGRVQERIVTLAAGERGFHTRTVLNAEHAASSHLALEYKVDEMSVTLPGYPVEQIQFLHRVGWVGGGGIVALTRMYMRMNHPRTARALLPFLNPPLMLARRTIYFVRRMKARLRGGAS
ncbi:rhamnosyltransferase [Microbacterium terrae]|uniref:rhamnan synthesis F family protein n=1 Tax=Microbacterium terrae TaxID=69369 RepID=UPI0014700FB2|nr:rhamnan synthesis F family protein [Microbacterium terrae]MBP1077981.1 rhamnosyltransferase [Microbacterium terrae]